MSVSVTPRTAREIGKTDPMSGQRDPEIALEDP